ncbi:MAG: hypothetical protein LBR28_00930 [Bacteroidales bacterium]|nr:hypothetical protein [Bacteroidales bacterium]
MGFTLCKFTKIGVRIQCIFLPLLFYFILCPVISIAQYYETGVDDCKLKWKQIKTSDFHIVYPDYYERNAQELARVLFTSNLHIGKTLNVSSLPNIPFLIHPQSVKSNGLTVWAPKRIELWTLEPDDTYSFPWLWQLALHEGRHAAQLKSLYQKGGDRILYSIFGEHIVGALLALYMPYWFLEGDAVVAETALSPVGRGDLPEFDFEFKANVLDKGRMKYDKAKLGSMKDFVPNRYNLGYHLVSFGREKYGKDIWGDVLEGFSSDFWKLAFWGDTKKGLKIRTEKLYQELIDSLIVKWKSEDKLWKEIYGKEKFYTYEWGKKDKEFINYYSPRFISPDSILALKTSYFETSQLVLITKTHEKKIVDLPFILSEHFDYKDGKILFSQYFPDQRWQHTSFADIVEYDLKTNTFSRLTFNQRLFLPYFNLQDTNSFTAISKDTLGNILLTSDGFIIKTSSEGKYIVKQEGKNDMEITNPSYDNLLKVRKIGNRIYYIQQMSNTYQLFSFDEKKPEYVTCHTNVRFGLSDFDIKDSLLVLNDYTANGYKIKVLPLTNMPAEAYITAKICNPNLLREEEYFTLEDIIDTTFESSQYKKATHLFNFHSFAPFVYSMQNNELNFGISGLSQNLLGTSIMQFGYKYKRIEKRDDFFVNYSYKGFLPVINLQLDYLKPSMFNRKNTNAKPTEFITSLNIQIPSQWVGFRFAHTFISNLDIGHRYIKTNNNSLLRHFNFAIFGLGIAYQIAKPMASNDLTTTLGETFMLRYYATVGNTRNTIMAATSTTYLPSLWRNHSFTFTFSAQYRNNSSYYFSDLIEVTRGYEDMLNENIFVPHSVIMDFRSVYNMPLCYPDFSLWKLLYIKRISAKPFYDCALKSIYWDNPKFNFISSAGSDILFDANFFRFETSVEIGARLGYLIEKNQPFASLILNFKF